MPSGVVVINLNVFKNMLPIQDQTLVFTQSLPDGISDAPAGAKPCLAALVQAKDKAPSRLHVKQ